MKAEGNRDELAEKAGEAEQAVGRRRWLVLAGLICLASVLLYARPLARPMLAQDDFGILRGSWTWQRTLAELWTPQNEHIMPLGRLLTFGLIRLAGGQTLLPLAGVLLGVVSLLAAILLLGLFVRRETGRPLPALVAMAVFGVSCVYQQAVYWMAAGFAVLALDFTLLALLAVQRWRQTERACHLDLALLACLAAPMWFASGVLAGPLCALYLLAGEAGLLGGAGGERARARRITLVPLAGTALFLVLSLARSGERLMHLEHYGDRTAVEAFQPLVGAGYTLRSVADNLVLGQLGICTVELPLPVVALVWLGLAAAGVLWWRRAPERALLVLGAGLIASAYLLIYSARATWPYEGLMTQVNMSRYHLLPQLGVALIVAGGLRGGAGPLSRRQARLLAGLTLLLFLIQLPRGILGYFRGHAGQQEVLRRLERVDALCREHGIAAGRAEQVLPRLEMPGGSDRDNAWTFLHGSDRPRDLSDGQVRRLLMEEGEESPRERK